MTEPWTRLEERPLTARSVIASTLLGVHPPRLPTGLLVRSCGLFGISDGTARVAISRMVAAGDLVPDDGGYALVGALLRRQSRQDRSRTGAMLPWTSQHGAWRMAVVTATGRGTAERTALRQAASGLRMAEVREGVWIRPDNLPVDPSDPAERELDAQCASYSAVPREPRADLAARLWDLGGWTSRAQRLSHALEATRPALDAHDLDVLPDAFVLSAATLRHLQADPLLPADLLPADWRGDALRQLHRGWDAAFAAVWVGWYRTART